MWAGGVAGVVVLVAASACSATGSPDAGTHEGGDAALSHDLDGDIAIEVDAARDATLSHDLDADVAVHVDAGMDAGVCTVDFAAPTTVHPAAGRCDLLPLPSGTTTECHIANAARYVVRSDGASGDLDLFVQIVRMFGESVTVSDGSTGCTCGARDSLSDPPGDFRRLATIPADGSPVGLVTTTDFVWACVPGDIPPQPPDASVLSIDAGVGG